MQYAPQVKNFNPLNSIYQAEAAYRLREFVKSKRYQINEITTTTVNIGDTTRAEVEAFIYKVFKSAYGADVTLFMPHLVALRDDDGVLMAAFGLRPATGGHLFLEQYLDDSIESILSEHLNKQVTREQITKIGNLAVANPRNAGVLVAHIIQHTLDLGIEWCVATAHHSLQNSVIKSGRDVYPLSPADKARLSIEEQAKWGNYYHHLPQVIAIRGNAQ